MATLFARGAGYAVVLSRDVPTHPTDPIAEALEGAPSSILLGATEDGGYYAVGAPRLLPRLFEDIPSQTPSLAEATRSRCRELGLAVHELPTCYAVDEPNDVVLLFDELRKHPERAPRTAQFLVTKA